MLPCSKYPCIDNDPAGPDTLIAYDADANGNTTTNLVYYPGIGYLLVNYEWDMKNQLVAVDAPGYSRSEFTYDGLGRRIRIVEKNSAGAVTSTRFFIWDGMRIASERASVSGSPVKTFFAQGDIRGTTKYYYAKDHLGNLREVSTATGAVVARYDYDAFGVPTQTLGTMQFDKLYTGHFYHQVSGLHLAPFRTYNPKMGRWISRDPIGMKGGINLYDYVGGNPLNGYDPLGLLTIFIHGTWSSSVEAFDVPFAKQVMKTFNDPNASFFNWSGNNSTKARCEAGRRLRDEINDYVGTHPNEPINIVAHSHGGNVALEASNLPGAAITTLVTLGTPIWETRLLGHEYKRGNIQTWLNVWSVSDIAQGMVGEQFSTEASNIMVRGANHSDMHTIGVWDSVFGKR